MSYADLADCTDGVVVVEQEDLDRADVPVAALLRQRGIPAAAETDISDEGRLLLRRLGAAHATAGAALRGLTSGGADDVLRAKATAYQTMARDLAALVDRESLGLAAPGSGAAGYASIPVGRA